MRALVLSGGGAKGAFQVGALEHILGDLQVHYDIITGISVGALNGSYLAQYPVGEEARSIRDLVAVWNTVDDRRIFKANFPMLGSTLSMALSAFGSYSFYNSEPLRNLVYDSLNVKKIYTSGKRLAIGAVSLSKGEVRYWEEDSPDIDKAVAASSSYPIFFAPVKIEDDLWTDGGIRNTIPIEKAISMGATEIDVILTGPIPENMHHKSNNTLSSLLTVISVLLDEVVDTDMLIGSLLADNQDIPVRLLFPSPPLGNSGLDFNPTSIKLNRELGYQAAQNINWNY